MLYKAEDLIRSVRVTLDENRTENEYISSEDNNMELNEIIREKLLYAVRAVLETAPLELTGCKPMVIPEAAQYMENDGQGYVVLPPDFLRLTFFKLRSWRCPVYGTYSENSDKARMQDNSFTRGTPIRPVCVLSYDLKGNKIMRYYIAGYENNGKYNRRDHRIDRALYISIPEWTGEENDEIDFDPLLREAIINYTAALVMVTRKDANAAESFFKIANSYLQR